VTVGLYTVEIEPEVADWLGESWSRNLGDGLRELRFHLHSREMRSTCSVREAGRGLSINSKHVEMCPIVGSSDHVIFAHAAGQAFTTSEYRWTRTGVTCLESRSPMLR
jgi:hypothetical protein